MDTNSTLFCSRCKSLQSNSEFRICPNKNGARELNGIYYHYYCHHCEKQSSKVSRRKRMREDYLHYIYTNKIKERQKKYSGDLIEFEQLNLLWEKQEGLCYWSKIPMIRFLDRRDALSVSVDRLDNKIGYEQGNCVLCCQFINVARQVQSPDEFGMYLNNFINFISPLVCIQESCGS